MTYFISGHRDITPEEFEKFYVPAIVDVIDTCNDNYDDCEFVVGDCRGCDEMAANFIANYIKENTDDVGTTTFLAEYPKPITLMRYIRKAIDSGELVIATTDAEV